MKNVVTSLPVNVIEKGTIKNKSNLYEFYYIIRTLNINDLIAISELQQELIESLDKKEVYMPIKIEEMQSMLMGKGEAIGLFIDNKLYAACSLLFDINDTDNMARELNFSREDLKLVAQLELSLVHSDLRGHNLQYKLASLLAQRLKQRKQSRYLFTTVSPYNYPSIKTVTSMGLQITKLCKMYYGWDRYIVYKDFLKPIILDVNNPIALPNTAFDQQKELFNKGYRGYSLYQDKDGIKIMFAKVIQ